MKSNRPVVRLMPGNVYHVDLRAKCYNRIRATVADGKKILQFQYRKEAESKANEIESLLTEHGNKRLETFDYVLREDPLTLQAKLTPFGKTIRDAVEFYVGYLSDESERQKSETVGNLLDRWLDAKTKEVKESTLRPRTLGKLREMATKYRSQWGERRIATLTSKEIEDWIEGLTSSIQNAQFEMAQQTKYHHWSYLSQFLTWCRRKHGVPKENPCESITIKRDDRDPIFFSPEQCQQIMHLSLIKRFVSLLPFHAICLFAGVRPSECQRLTWDSIDFTDKTILIQKSEAKTRKHRRVEMQSTLIEWLMRFREQHPKKPLIPTVNFDDLEKRFRKEIGFWSPNGMRHSYASYYLGGIRRDFGSLEANMGNSRTMLQNHYVKFPTKQHSEMFWNIRPPANGALPTTRPIRGDNASD